MEEMGEMAGEEVDREAAIEALLSLLDIGLPPNDDTLLASEVRDDTPHTAYRIPHITFHAQYWFCYLSIHTAIMPPPPLRASHRVLCTYKRLTLYHTMN